MRKLLVYSILLFILISCGLRSRNAEEPEQRPVTDVSVTSVSYGHIDKEIELSAVTAFLKKSVVAAPISSFIKFCQVQPGTMVNEGQTLYRLESKERSALGSEVMDADMGVVDVKANTSGVVTEVQRQSGDYVPEGSTLCTIANVGSMVFEVDVPAEDMKYAKAGTTCRIELPDGGKVSAVLSTPLATMDVNAQVQQVPAKARTSFLPEGLRAKVLLKVSDSGNKMQILPKSAVQSDDNMTSFWIMKVGGNSSARKIAVTIGNSDNEYVEITSPVLSSEDRIITAGSYQLQDGDKVKIAE